MSNVEELRRKFQEFRTACKTILPKVDPMLVEDVILRQQQNPQEQLMYTVEVFTDGSSQKMLKRLYLQIQEWYQKYTTTVHIT
jgi:hypothetical protein